VLILVVAACAVLTAAVVALAALPSNTVPPSIDDVTPVVGETLTGNDGTWAIDPEETGRTREWLGGSGNVNGQTYLVKAGDVGNTLVYRVTVSNADGPATADSAATAAVAQAPAPPTPAGSWTITSPNANVGASVSVTSTGTWSGTQPIATAREWVRCTTTAVGSCSVIGPANAAYVLAAPADLNAYIRLRETAANGVAPDGVVFSNAVGPVTQPPSPPTPTVSGTPAVGQTLTANEGTVTGTPTPTFAYQWQRCGPGGGSCGDIGGATGKTYVVQPADAPAAGARLRVRVSASNSAGTAGPVDSPSVGPVTGPPFNDGTQGTVLPSITGTPALGQTLTAVPGTWLGFPAPTFAYQWQRCDVAGTPASCVNIATGPTYAVQAADAPATGARIRVVVLASNASASNVAVASPAVGPVQSPPTNTGVAPMALPTIADSTPDDTWFAGETLTASPGTWLGFPAPTFVFHWLRCARTSLTGISSSCTAVATGGTYVLTPADVGWGIRLAVVGSNAAGSSPPPTDLASVKALVTRIVNGPPVADGQNGSFPPGALSGAAERGKQLVASSGGWVGYPRPTVTHQWQHCADAGGTDCQNIGGPVTVATAVGSVAPVLLTANSTYLLTDAEMGRFVRVLVTATNGIGAPVALASPFTAQVVGAPIIAANGEANLPTITGTAQEGLAVAGSTGTWSAFPGGDQIAYAFQWMRCSGVDTGTCAPIAGATSEAYVIQNADVGQRLRFRVTAANGIPPDGVGFSSATPPVTARAVGGGGGPGSGVDLLLSSRTSTAGGRVTYTLTSFNLGSQPATGVSVVASVANARVVSASAEGGTCTVAGQTSCALGTLAAGASRRSTIVVEAAQTGNITLSVSVRSAEADVNPSNNALTIASHVVVTSDRSPTATTNPNAPGNKATPVGAKVVKAVKAKLLAKRVGKTWVVDTRFSLVSGTAKLVLTVTPNGSRKQLAFLKGTRLGDAIAKKTSRSLNLDAPKPATFPVRVVMAAKGFSRTKIYVIRIAATAPNGLSSSLDIGFSGTKILGRPTVAAKLRAKRVGGTWVLKARSPLVPAKGRLQVWVTPNGTMGRSLTLVKGSRGGKALVRGKQKLISVRVGKAARVAVAVALPAKGLSPKQTYVLRMQTIGASGPVAQVDLGFRVPAPRVAAGAAAR
jgi:hypothetical protein